MPAHRHSISELSRLIRARELAATDVTRSALDRIARSDPGIGAFLQTFPDEALARAAQIDDRLRAGDDPGPLAGVPVAVKDNICTTLGRTTCASRMLENYRSPFNATAVSRLLDAGAVIVGKTNLDEFAMGSSTENSALGVTRNPWDPSRVPGGSSGGSAAAVASGMVPGALGSDTGGSVRQPAAFCGVVGLKPTYGRVSRWGLVAYASSLDQIGTIATSVTDTALLLSTIWGFDELDSTSTDAPAPDLIAQLDSPFDPLRLGVPSQARSPSNHPAVNRAFDDAVATFKALGAAIVEIELPHLDYAIASYYIVALAEASSNLARFDGVRYGRRAPLAPADDLFDLYARSRAQGLGREVQRRIMLGTYALSSGYYDAYYLTALKARRLITQDFDSAFARAGCHAVLTPTTPSPPFSLGEKTSDPVLMYLEDAYTVPVNLAGLPAISLPCGFTEVDGTTLPIGLQLIAPAFQEPRLLRIARMYESASGLSDRIPGG